MTRKLSSVNFRFSYTEYVNNQPNGAVKLVSRSLVLEAQQILLFFSKVAEQGTVCSRSALQTSVSFKPGAMRH